MRITKSCMGKRSIQSLRQTNGFYVREQKKCVSNFTLWLILKKMITCQVLV